MKQLLLLCLFFPLLLPAENRLALVIGNSNYASIGKLKSPINDADDMAILLKECGFEVMKITKDASRKEMEDCINHFGRKLKEQQGVGLFYYSGHGMAESGKNYLMPVDFPATIDYKHEIERNAVPLELIKNVMIGANNGQNIIFLDACRTELQLADKKAPILGSSITGEMDAQNIFIGYATNSGNEAIDGINNRNSPFTAALMYIIRKDKGLELTEIFRNVRGEVKKKFPQQQPNTEGITSESFYFFPEIKGSMKKDSDNDGIVDVLDKCPNEYGKKEGCPENTSEMYKRNLLIGDKGFKVDWKDGMAGFIDTLGNVLIPYEYEHACCFKKGMAIVERDYMYGCINKQNETVIPFKYDYISHFSDEGIAMVALNGKYGYINREGKEISPLKYDEVENFEEGRGWVRLDTLYGFVDEKGKEITPIKYDQVNNFQEGFATVKLKQKWSYINKTGKELIPFKYDSIGGFSEGLAQVSYYKLFEMKVIDEDGIEREKTFANSKNGFIDIKGNEVIPIKYDEVRDFHEGLAKVKLNEKWGLIDMKGNEVVSIKYGYVDDFQEGLAVVELNRKWGFIDMKENEVIPIKYNFAAPFNQGLAKVKLGRKWGFIDKQGKVVIPIIYDDTYHFENGLACVNLNKKYGAINNKGEVVIPIIYDNLYTYDFFKNGHKTDYLKLNEKYDTIIPMNGNYIAVKLMDKWGVINDKDEAITPIKYDSICGYNMFGYEGAIPILLSNKWGYIDQYGNELIKPSYDEVHCFSEGIASVKLNEKWGYINKTGKIVIPTISDEYIDWIVNDQNSWTYKVIVMGKNYLYFNRKGEYIMESKCGN